LKKVYVDTNVLLAAFHTKDPYHNYANAILSSAKLEKVISPLTLAELTSVISRLRKNNSLKLPDNIEDKLSKISFEKQVYSIALFIIRHANVSIEGLNLALPINLNGMTFKAPTEFLEAHRIAPTTQLRSLDNLHIAVASMLLKRGTALNHFTTCDEKMLNLRDVLVEMLGIPITSPEELAKIEGL